MKIILNTETKVIELQDDTKFEDLINFLEVALPNDLWKEFSLKTNTVINWVDRQPITIINPWINPLPSVPDPFYPHYPWLPNPVVCDFNGSNISMGSHEGKISCSTSNFSLNDLNQGVFNVDVKSKEE